MADLYHPTRRHLLRDLTGAGIGAAGAGVVGRELLGGDAEVADAAAHSCTLSAEVTEGPYASTCKPIEDVAVEIWHADAGGTYSGFSQEGTAGKTYLRGVQLTGESGVAQFPHDLSRVVCGPGHPHPHACATARTASTTRPAPALSSAYGGARRARSARG